MEEATEVPKNGHAPQIMVADGKYRLKILEKIEAARAKGVPAIDVINQENLNWGTVGNWLTQAKRGTLPVTHDQQPHLAARLEKELGSLPQPKKALSAKHLKSLEKARAAASAAREKKKTAAKTPGKQRALDTLQRRAHEKGLVTDPGIQGLVDRIQQIVSERNEYKNALTAIARVLDALEV